MAHLDIYGSWANVLLSKIVHKKIHLVGVVSEDFVQLGGLNEENSGANDVNRDYTRLE